MSRPGPNFTEQTTYVMRGRPLLCLMRREPGIVPPNVVFSPTRRSTASQRNETSAERLIRHRWFRTDRERAYKRRRTHPTGQRCARLPLSTGPFPAEVSLGRRAERLSVSHRYTFNPQAPCLSRCDRAGSILSRVADPNAFALAQL